jgi:hypothetical protein
LFVAEKRESEMAAAEAGSQPTACLPGCSGDPATFRQVFEQELDQIRCRRKVAGQQSNLDPPGELKGLALSGGGIRSATYCLGVLQKFSQLGLLTQFDYLSTVSGGGFIGGWWSAWFSRSQHSGGFPPAEQIKPGREPFYRKKMASGLTDSSISAGVDPIHHVRLFSNYLTPRKGALSLDTWRVITVGLRNLLFTWLILLPVMVAVILLAQLYFVFFQPHFFQRIAEIRTPQWSQRVRLILAPLIFLGGLFVTTSFAWLVNTWDSDSRGTSYIRWISVLTAFIAGVVVTRTLAHEVLWKGDLYLKPYSQLSAGVVSSLWLAVAIAALIWCYWPARIRQRPPDELGTRLTQACQAILVTVVAVGAVLGFFGFAREFWAYVLSKRVAAAGGWIAVLGSLASIAFTLWKGLPTGGGDLRAEGRRSVASQIVFAIAPPAALLLIGLIALKTVDRSFAHLLSSDSELGRSVFYGSAVAFVVASMACCLWEVWWQSETTDWLHWVLVGTYTVLLGGLIYGRLRGLATKPVEHPEFFVFIGVALMFGWVGTFGWYVDPNALSLHGFYKARLTRAYLGASNFQRQNTTSEITDAVSGDDVLLSELQNCRFGAPYHLINSTLNLVGGHDLSTAQRLAEPFLFSKLYCGAVGGYRPTESYMAGRLTLGTAVAVSGAAVSPNMGSMTVGSALAMLMTFFNIRLGYWAPTPNHASWRSPQARHWPWYTLREFLSQTTDQASYCYLSDGGHFDNTGVYSLIQRACKLIVMVDCGADPRPCFEDLGEVIRRCRIDFGTKIDIDISALTNAGSPVTRCLRGTIIYSEEHLKSLGRSQQDRWGMLILIKPSLTLDEATGIEGSGDPTATADIRQFRITNSDYPQISTADQWFGEAEFESYRQLGELSAQTLASFPLFRLF